MEASCGESVAEGFLVHTGSMGDENLMTDELQEQLDDPRITLWGLMVEVHAELARRIDGEISEVTGLPPTWFEVLLRLGRTPKRAVRLTTLGKMVSFTSGGISKLADRIEAAGLICREPDPQDRRAALVSLTEQGRATLHRGLRAHIPSLQRHLMGHLTAEQLAQAEALLRSLRRALTGGPDTP